MQVWCYRCKSDTHFTVSCPWKEPGVLLEASDQSRVLSLLILKGEEVPPEQKKFMDKVKLQWLNSK